MCTRVPPYFRYISIARDYIFNGQKLPAVSASASKDSLGNIHISLVNIDPAKSAVLKLNINGDNFKNVSGRILNSCKNPGL